MNQSRTASLIESVFNVVIGYGVALADNIEITAIFTVASIVRGYLVRRSFVKWGRG